MKNKMYSNKEGHVQTKLGLNVVQELKINQRRILIDSLEIGIPAPEHIMNLGERQLPNGVKVGQLLHSKTLNYKKFTPHRDGLFCERIFGPVQSFVCACGKKREHVQNKKKHKTEIETLFCPKCEVEYTTKSARRHRLGYIKLFAPVTHIWYLKGRPSYLSLFLGKRKKAMTSLAYCNAYLVEQTYPEVLVETTNSISNHARPIFTHKAPLVVTHKERYRKRVQLSCRENISTTYTRQKHDHFGSAYQSFAPIRFSSTLFFNSKNDKGLMQNFVLQVRARARGWMQSKALQPTAELRCAKAKLLLPKQSFASPWLMKTIFWDRLKALLLYSSKSLFSKNKDCFTRAVLLRQSKALFPARDRQYNKKSQEFVMIPMTCSVKAKKQGMHTGGVQALQKRSFCTAGLQFMTSAKAKLLQQKFRQNSVSVTSTNKFCRGAAPIAWLTSPSSGLQSNLSYDELLPKKAYTKALQSVCKEHNLVSVSSKTVGAKALATPPMLSSTPQMYTSLFLYKACRSFANEAVGNRRCAELQPRALARTCAKAEQSSASTKALQKLRFCNRSFARNFVLPMPANLLLVHEVAIVNDSLRLFHPDTRALVHPSQKQSLQSSCTNWFRKSNLQSSALHKPCTSRNECVGIPYIRAQTLPFLPSLICSFYLRDCLISFLQSGPSREDIPIPLYCQSARRYPLRDIHKFLAEVRSTKETSRAERLTSRSITSFINSSTYVSEERRLIKISDSSAGRAKAELMQSPTFQIACTQDQLGRYQRSKNKSRVENLKGRRKVSVLQDLQDMQKRGFFKDRTVFVHTRDDKFSVLKKNYSINSLVSFPMRNVNEMTTTLSYSDKIQVHWPLLQSQSWKTRVAFINENTTLCAPAVSASSQLLQLARVRAFEHSRCSQAERSGTRALRTLLTQSSSLSRAPYKQFCPPGNQSYYGKALVYLNNNSLITQVRISSAKSLLKYAYLNLSFSLSFFKSGSNKNTILFITERDKRVEWINITDIPLTISSHKAGKAQLCMYRNFVMQKFDSCKATAFISSVLPDCKTKGCTLLETFKKSERKIRRAWLNLSISTKKCMTPGKSRAFVQQRDWSKVNTTKTSDRSIYENRNLVTAKLYYGKELGCAKAPLLQDSLCKAILCKSFMRSCAKGVQLQPKVSLFSEKNLLPLIVGAELRYAHQRCAPKKRLQNEVFGAKHLFIGSTFSTLQNSFEPLLHPGPVGRSSNAYRRATLKSPPERIALLHSPHKSMCATPAKVIQKQNQALSINGREFLQTQNDATFGSRLHHQSGPLSPKTYQISSSFLAVQKRANSSRKSTRKENNLFIQAQGNPRVLARVGPETISKWHINGAKEILSYTGGGALESLLKRFHTQQFCQIIFGEIQILRQYYKDQILVESTIKEYHKDQSGGEDHTDFSIKEKSLRLSRINTKGGANLFCRRIYRTVRRLKVVQLLMRNKRRPEWMMISILPVLPPDLRPVLQMGENLIVASDLNTLYQRVIYRNNRHYKGRFLDFHFVSSIHRLVQDAVDRLIENGKGGSTPFSTPGGRPLKSLSDILKGKRGRFRFNLLGKRVDFSGRSVIVVSPNYKIHECGLPREMALELYKYLLIRQLLLQKRVSSIVHAKKVIKERQPFIWDLLREIIYYHPLLLNRAPTLHRLGIQAFQPKLTLGNAILLHPLVCAGFNADFDGDQMGVHLPLSPQARAEAWDLLWSRNNLLSPATGQPILLPSQDMVLGFYYMTALLPYDTSFRSSSKDLARAKSLLRYKNNQGGRGQHIQLQSEGDLRNSYAKLSAHRTILCKSGAFATEALHTKLQRSGGSKALLCNARVARALHAKAKSFELTQLFTNIFHAINAYQKKQIDIHTPIWVKWVGKSENGEKSQVPLEVRINAFGYSTQIYSTHKYQNKISFTKPSFACKQMVNTKQSFATFYMRTTAGRILVNTLLIKE